MNKFLFALGVMFASGPTASGLAAGSYVLTNLGKFSDEYQSSAAYDVNAHGQVVGQVTSRFTFDTSFLWTPTVPNGTVGSMVPLGGIYDTAVGINSFGQVVACATSCAYDV